MELEKAAGLVALAWLVGSLILIARSVREGRSLADSFATRHPQLYESLGRPRPGYFDSVQRTRFARFVARREFENLADPVLAEQFEQHRKSEARLLIFMLASLGAVGLLVLAVRHAA